MLRASARQAMIAISDAMTAQIKICFWRLRSGSNAWSSELARMTFPDDASAGFRTNDWPTYCSPALANRTESNAPIERDVAVERWAVVSSAVCAVKDPIRASCRSELALATTLSLTRNHAD